MNKYPTWQDIKRTQKISKRRKEENERRNKLILSLTSERKNDKMKEVKYENHDLFKIVEGQLS